MAPRVYRFAVPAASCRVSAPVAAITSSRAWLALVLLVLLFWPVLHSPPATAALPDKDAFAQVGFANKASSLEEPVG